MKPKIVIIILAVIVLISCSGDQTFREIKIKESDVNKINVMGYGTGKSYSSDEIAKDKAKTNATVNLIDQVSGREFVYEKSNGSVKFTTNSGGTLSDVQEAGSYCLGDKKYLIVLSSPIEMRDIELDKALLLETSFRTENLEKSLTEKYQKAIERTIEKKYPGKARLEGKLYLSDIKISDYEGKDDFKVTIRILIIISRAD